MTLRSTIISDVATVFTNTNDFAETVLYRPLGGATRSISAVVFRQVAELISDAENRLVTVFEVHIKNDGCSGIATSELNLGGDQIDIAERIGKAAKPRAIVQVIDQDEGMLVLQCR